MNLKQILAFAVLNSCGALPHTKKAASSAPINSAAAMTGLVVLTTENWTSTSLHLYDLRKGEVELLVGGESSDVMAAWLNDSLYVFNRGGGRVSYSRLAPSAGATSRTPELATPGAGTFDPAAAAVTTEGELLLSINEKGSLVVATEVGNRTVAELTGVNTGSAEQPFRPAGIHVSDNGTAWVSHQALNRKFEASGGGALYGAAKSDGAWAWIDPLGIALSVTNPVYLEPRGENEFLVAGVCYPLFGELCTSGVDRVNLTAQKSEHVSDWDKNKWGANGSFYMDLTDVTLLVCAVKRDGGEKKNVLARYEVGSGAMTIVKLLEGAGCGGVVADRKSQQIYIGEPTADGKGVVSVLGSNNQVLDVLRFDEPVSGLTAIYEN